MHTLTLRAPCVLCRSALPSSRQRWLRPRPPPFPRPRLEAASALAPRLPEAMPPPRPLPPLLLRSSLRRPAQVCPLMWCPTPPQQSWPNLAFLPLALPLSDVSLVPDHIPPPAHPTPPSSCRRCSHPGQVGEEQRRAGGDARGAPARRRRPRPVPVLDRAHHRRRCVRARWRPCVGVRDKVFGAGSQCSPPLRALPPALPACTGASLTEVEVDEHLTARRSAQQGFVEPSFPTIAGAGPHGAIIHYRAQPGTCRSVDASTLLLLDSGGQYDCGTTDITRTMHFGQPTQHQRACFTRVLQVRVCGRVVVWTELHVCKDFRALESSLLSALCRLVPHHASCRPSAAGPHRPGPDGVARGHARVRH